MCWQEEPNPFVRAERLLDHMYRRCDEDFARFCAALRKTRQEHVLEQLLNVCMAVSESGFIAQTVAPAAAGVEPLAEKCLPLVEEMTAVNDKIEVEQLNDDIVCQRDQCECQCFLSIF